ncbi:cytochrome P450 [Marasmius fiardii PR-910]|nr:cytochrome P450 [Marasmius fiardii PR-910]
MLTQPWYTIAVSLLLAKVVATVLYRILFHPLQKFPGPWLAAITEYYRAYYEVFCDGGWVDHLEVLHKQYGPAVRVCPNELHFIDPDAHHDIYVASKVPKDPTFYLTTSPTPGSLSSEVDPKEAAKRRFQLGQYVSRKAVLQLEERVQEKVNKLITKLLSYEQLGKPANLHYGYRATTFDIISSYVFAQETDTLDAPGFQHSFLISMDGLFHAAWILKYFPLPLDRLPEWICRKIAPITTPLWDERQFIANKIDETLRLKDHDPEDKKAVFEIFLRYSSEGIPRWKLIDEGVSFQIAATDTTANACVTGTFHLLTNPKVLLELRKELDGVWNNTEEDVKYEQLEHLPYLGAVIRESLRLSCGVSTPTPRLVGDEEVTIAGFTVPPDTIIACASYMIHSNPTLFPEPDKFIPERWLGENGHQLEKYLVAFSKGPRTCLGINLAWCELYLILGNVFRKLDLEAYEAQPEDMRFRDYILPHYNNPLHVRVNGLRS